MSTVRSISCPAANNPDGNRTSNGYSTVGQLTSRKYPDGSRATFSYDSVGNRTLMVDSTGRYTSTYDAVGQTMVTASPNNQRQTFSYDAIGLRRSMDATGAGRSTYLFDAANQLSSLRNGNNERTSFSYDDSGRRTVQRNANGTRVSMSYDAASQTTQVFHRTSAGATLLQLDYAYDPAGNRKSMAEDGTAARTTWTYDKQNQLLGEYRTGTNPYRQTFTYDPAGNRILKNVDTVRTTYAYDAANQLRYGQAVAGRTTYVYDPTGNQQIEQPPTGNRTTTTWTYENQPTQYLLSAGGSPVTMSYNGDNRRVISQQGTDTTKFVWDATTDAYIAELDGSNILIATYTNEPQQYGGILSQRRGTTTSTLHADALGTTRLLTDSTQTETDTYLFDAWGNQVASTGSTVNPFKWVGRYGYYTDSLTGLVYVRARMYQPTVARWCALRVQPFGFNDSRPNTYAYFISGLKTAQNKSGEDLMPSIDVSLVNPPNSVSCSAMNSSTIWSFRLKKSNSPCNGFIVQKVTVDCTIDKCNGESVESSHYVYYESWRILDGEQIPETLSGHDTARWHAGNTYCVKGAYSQATEIRFYCNSDVGLPINDQKSDIPRWNPSKSDTIWYPTSVPQGPCSTSPFALSSSGEATFWDSVPNRASNVGTRNITLFFHCCPKRKPCCGDGVKKPTFYYRPPEYKWHKNDPEQND